MALTLERLLAAALAVMVIAFASGSTIFNVVLLYGRDARWAALGALVVLALAYALTARPWGTPPPFVYAAGALVVVALTSSLWSVDGWLTLKRAGSFAVLVIAGGALLVGARGRAEGVRRLLLGLLAGMAAVALAGLVALAVSYHQAVQPASFEYPARFRGFGQNPNTVPLLLAIGTPLAVLLALGEGRSRLERAAALAMVGLFAGSIAASGSRGAMLGALTGTLVLVLGRGGARRRQLELAVATLGAFGLCVGLSQIPQPKPAPPSSTGSAGVAAHQARRTLFTSSGRTEAWRGAIHQAEQRPVAGYGFGTEELAFVNRYPGFFSELPENSYIGAALQVGLVGLLLLIASAVAALSVFVRALRRPPGLTRLLASACAGATVAALVVGVTESYLFAVGGIATTSVWLCMFLLAANEPAA
jgi:O-antigen ligase